MVIDPGEHNIISKDAQDDKEEGEDNKDVQKTTPSSDTDKMVSEESRQNLRFGDTDVTVSNNSIKKNDDVTLGMVIHNSFSWGSEGLAPYRNLN